MPTSSDEANLLSSTPLAKHPHLEQIGSNHHALRALGNTNVKEFDLSGIETVRTGDDQYVLADKM